MNLREQFEKETGKYYNRAPFTYFHWLEQRNKEQVEVLDELIGLASDAIRAHGYDPTDDETIQKAEEQLNKSGEL